MIASEVLGCGITLVTERMDGARSASLGVWVGTGSRDELDAQSGTSHFLEHLLFKGTPEWSASAIAEAVDEVGGDMDAFTTKEYTAFSIRLLAEDLPLGVRVLGAIMTDPAFRPDEVDAERQVILDEVRMHADEPADLAGEQYMTALFPGHPLGRDVLGAPASVSSIGPGEIRSFFDLHYRTGNMVVSAAGDVDHERLAAEIDRCFELRRGGERPARSAPVVGSEALALTTRSTEQAHVVLGVRVPGRRAPERYALGLLNHVLGGGISSRLFQEVRERRGLAYAIWSERLLYEEVGSLCVSVGTAPEHASEVIGLVNAEIDRLGDSGVSSRELALAKSHLRADTLLSLEDSGARMGRIGSSMLLHGEVPEVDEIIGRVDSVSVEEVGSLGARIAAAKRTLSVVGPFEEGRFASEPSDSSACLSAGGAVERGAGSQER